MLIHGSFKICLKSGLEAHIWNPSTQEAEAERSSMSLRPAWATE